MLVLLVDQGPDTVFNQILKLYLGGNHLLGLQLTLSQRLNDRLEILPLIAEDRLVPRTEGCK